MLTVHHLNNSRSQRVLWLLEELALPYEIKFYQRNAKTMLAPPELSAIHPLGKSPVVTDDGAVIAETGAIIEYIVEKSGGRLRPAAGTPERLRWTYWLHYSEGSLMPPLVMRLIFSLLPARSPALMRVFARPIAARTLQGWVDPQLKTHFDFIESELGRFRMVRRRRLLRRRRDDELSPGSRRRPRERVRRATPHQGLRGGDSRAAGVSQGAGEGRAL